LTGGVKVSELYGRITVQHGDNSVRQKKVYQYLERFKGALKNYDDAFSGRISAACCDVKEQIDQCIRDN
jgi:hypothetical protein